MVFPAPAGAGDDEGRPCGDGLVAAEDYQGAHVPGEGVDGRGAHGDEPRVVGQAFLKAAVDLAGPTGPSTRPDRCAHPPDHPDLRAPGRPRPGRSCLPGRRPLADHGHQTQAADPMPLLGSTGSDEGRSNVRNSGKPISKFEAVLDRRSETSSLEPSSHSNDAGLPESASQVLHLGKRS